MALMRPVTNCYFNHNADHEGRPLPTCACHVLKQEYLLQTTFVGAFPFQTEVRVRYTSIIQNI